MSIQPTRRRFLISATTVGAVIGTGEWSGLLGFSPANAREATITPDLVRYSAEHNGLKEWIYNAAAIDSAPVVWAREMDPVNNRKLLEYFEGRRVWLVEPDSAAPVLRAYPP